MFTHIFVTTAWIALIDVMENLLKFRWGQRWMTQPYVQPLTRAQFHRWQYFRSTNIFILLTKTVKGPMNLSANIIHPPIKTSPRINKWMENIVIVITVVKRFHSRPFFISLQLHWIGFRFASHRISSFEIRFYILSIFQRDSLVIQWPIH